MRLDFKIFLQKNQGYYPIHLAAMKEKPEIIRIFLQNPTIDINVTVEGSGINAFWIAASYGNNRVLNELIKIPEVEIYNCHAITKCNALHVAV